MTCIWINPVVAKMTDEKALSALLQRHHLEQVFCREDWGSVVREKYRKLVREHDGRVFADARCPMAVELIHGISQTNQRIAEQLEIAPIEPILLHCAREIAERAELSGREKLIITPCEALAEQGNQLCLPYTRFQSWRSFLSERGEHSAALCRPIPESPIPPGYFAGSGICVKSLQSAAEIKTAFRSGSWKEAALLELLYCEGGCHRGEGV